MKRGAEGAEPDASTSLEAESGTAADVEGNDDFRLLRDSSDLFGCLFFSG